jgi:polysaccharide export outer membrane protein
VNPFVRIEVTNRSVYVFKGRSGATEVLLDKANMNLLEVLAKAGGMPPDAKAFNIRIIRGDLKNPQVVKIDLSTLEGMKQANLTVQANDFVYIEPTVSLDDVVVKLTPIITLLSTTVLIFTTISYFKK